MTFCRDGTETLSVAFSSAEKRQSWEEAFTEAKLKLRGALFFSGKPISWPKIDK
jgi:hypothetical protein